MAVRLLEQFFMALWPLALSAAVWVSTMSASTHRDEISALVETLVGPTD
jgi:hypothetical protein